MNIFFRRVFVTAALAVIAVAQLVSVATPSMARAETSASAVVPGTVPDVVTDTARESVGRSSEPVIATTKDPTSLKCPQYKVYYIDPSAQFFTPPVPLEDHAEFVFCSDHENLDAIRTKLSKMKPIGSHPDVGAARIKVIPRGKASEAMIFCSTGEITYRGKQFRLDRRTYEPSLLSLREEGDRQRSMAIEQEDDADPRGPASEEKSGKKPAKKKVSVTAPASQAGPATSGGGTIPAPTGTPVGF